MTPLASWIQHCFMCDQCYFFQHCLNMIIVLIKLLPYQKKNAAYYHVKLKMNRRLLVQIMLLHHMLLQPLIKNHQDVWTGLNKQAWTCVVHIKDGKYDSFAVQADQQLQCGNTLRNWTNFIDESPWFLSGDVFPAETGCWAVHVLQGII